MIRDVIEINERVFGPEHANTLKSKSNLAATLNQQGRHAEAEKIYLQTIQIQEQTVGPEHESTLHSKMGLANAIKAQGHFFEAEMLYRQVIEVGNQALGPEHPLVLKSIGNMANAINFQGRRAEAEKLYRQTMELSERIFGPEHPTTLHFRGIADWGHVAQMLYRAGRFQEARSALEMVIHSRGDEAPSVNSGPRWWYYSMTLWQLGERERAVETFEELSRVMQETPPKKPEVFNRLRAEAAKRMGIDDELRNNQ